MFTASKYESKTVNANQNVLEPANFYVSKSGNLRLNTTDDYTGVILCLNSEFMMRFDYKNYRYLPFETKTEILNFARNNFNLRFSSESEPVLIFKGQKFHHCTDRWKADDYINRLLSDPLFVTENFVRKRPLTFAAITAISGFLTGLFVGKKFP